MKAISLVTVLLISLLMSACGEAADTSGLSGSYVLQSAADNEVQIQDSRIAELRLCIRLNPGGEGTVSAYGAEQGSVHWQYQDNRVSITIGDVCLEGIREGSSLLLQQKGTDILLCFMPEEESVQTDNTYKTETPAESPAEFPPDWYGWWKAEYSEGVLPSSWYDCCAAITAQEDGTFLFTIWDEDGNRQEPLGEVLLSLNDSSCFSSVNGYFLYDNISAGEWVIPVPNQEFLAENLKHDANGEVFSYTFYLRPWGADWNDLENSKWPFYYEDWYLPLIEQNEPMPDFIPWEKLESNRETLER